MATYQSVTEQDRIVTEPHLERARASLRAAELLAGEGLNHDAVTRAHQATIHAERALLATEVRSPQDPRSVHRLTVNHFLGNGLLDEGYIARLDALATLRGRADDQPLKEISAEECATALGDAGAFVADVEGRLAGGGEGEAPDA